jgi:L-lysine exporter family protein LysE/ArgO
MSMIVPYLQGLGTGAGLIVAIGAQNAFVLSQSIRRNHHLSVCLVCALCDAALITLGVLGTGKLIVSNPMLMKPAAWGGAAFLAWYGLGAFRSAIKGNRLEENEVLSKDMRSLIMLTLGISLLNPHAYLDTVVMLGSMSGQYAGDARYAFGLGGITSSFLWFYTLGLGGQALAPLFRKPGTWRVLDTLIGFTMWIIALGFAKKAMNA